jgi:hypothetical protein
MYLMAKLAPDLANPAQELALESSTGRETCRTYQGKALQSLQETEGTKGY